MFQGVGPSSELHDSRIDSGELRFCGSIQSGRSRRIPRTRNKSESSTNSWTASGYIRGIAQVRSSELAGFRHDQKNENSGVILNCVTQILNFSDLCPNFKL